MNPFNKRLAPPRVFGLPLAAALASLVTIMGILLAVVLPRPIDAFALLVGVAALPLGILATMAGDDIVFYGVFRAARSEGRLAFKEALWL